NAISLRSVDSVKFAASARPPDMRVGFAAVGDAVHNAPLRENRISPGETHANDPMSDVRMSGSTGKSVRAVAFWPGATTNRSCLPHASHRNAIVLPSGDHAGADGYLIWEMRSMVMLPRGGSASAGAARHRSRAAPIERAGTFMADDYRLVRLKPPFDVAQGGPEALEGPDATYGLDSGAGSAGCRSGRTRS